MASIRLQSRRWTAARDLDRVGFLRRRGMRERVERERGQAHMIPVPWPDAATSCTSIGASVATLAHITFCVRCQASSLRRVTLPEERTCGQSRRRPTNIKDCVAPARALPYCPAIRSRTSAFTPQRAWHATSGRLPAEPLHQSFSLAVPLQELPSNKPQRAHPPYTAVHHGVFLCCGRTAVSPAQTNAERQEHIRHKLWPGGQQCLRVGGDAHD
jgi:hypothetical protein